jgi:excinuclease Cho
LVFEESTCEGLLQNFKCPTLLLKSGFSPKSAPTGAINSHTYSTVTESLLELAAQLPEGPGVYFLKGTGELPLYIGKSIHIRQRVLSHLRDKSNQRMLSQTTHFEWTSTAGEIGALLLESRLIKSLNPIYNIRLRRSKTLSTLGIKRQDNGEVQLEWLNLKLAPSAFEERFGLFRSKRAGESELLELAQNNHLCLSRLGLEAKKRGACFAWQLKKCLGVCVGEESKQSHDARLLNAIREWRIHSWPYPSHIDIIERQGTWEQRHRIHHWRHIQTHCSKAKKIIWQDPEVSTFDLDTYKILVRPIFEGSLNIAGSKPQMPLHSIHADGFDVNTPL